LEAAGIDFASEGEEPGRHGDLLRLHALNGQSRPGGSSWQSLARAAGDIEADYLYGEDRPPPSRTPSCQQLLQRLAIEMALAGTAPGAVAPDEFLARVDADRCPATLAANAHPCICARLGDRGHAGASAWCGCGDPEGCSLTFSDRGVHRGGVVGAGAILPSPRCPAQSRALRMMPA
jgi:hypothetical protein